ncbi:MAG: signal peptidase I [Alphaproteobacteria bacterium]|nr:signal peptidase I [Alphaproteobacteria bacterium]
MTSNNNTDKTDRVKAGEIQETEALKKKAADGGDEPSGLRAWLWNDTVQTVFYAFLIAIAVRIVAFEPFNIPSGSMKPTLLVGDYLFVSKYTYGYSRYSFPFGFPPFSGRIWESPVERGDVAVFRKPPENEIDYIKRIIGLPGDRIQVLDGILHINGEAVERERIEDFVVDAYGREAAQYIETLPNGRTHRILETAGDAGRSDNTDEVTVPAGHYFAMGDNRDNSADSRVIGFIPAENMVGRAEILFFSTDGSAALWEFWKWPFAVRYSRLFDGVE